MNLNYCTYIVCQVHTDMLTIQASGWNKRKAENLDRTLAKRYIKVLTRQICIITFLFLNCLSAFVNTDISFGQIVQRITEATKDLEKLTAELSLQQDTVQQWVSEVQQWTSGTEKNYFKHILKNHLALFLYRRSEKRLIVN